MLHPCPLEGGWEKKGDPACSLQGSKELNCVARSHFVPSCPALGTAGTSRNTRVDLHPIPSAITPGCAAKPCREVSGGPRAAGGAGRRAETSTQGAGVERWKPSKLPLPLYKSCSKKIIIPKKFSPGSATRLLPRRPTERGLHSRPCTHAGGKKCLQVRQAPQEGQDPRCFHTKDL